MKTKLNCLLMVLALLAGATCLRAQGTTAFTYQGQLRDGGTNANGTYAMTFKLYDSVSSGIQIGSTLASSPALANGLFTVNLDFGAGAFNGTARWLEINVAGDVLTPRVQVLPAPYALYAAVAATVTNGAIMNSQLATNAVATTNLQNNAVTTAQIADGAVTNRNLATNAVATANIQNGAVTNPKLALSAVATFNLTNDAVTTAKILDGNVTNSKLAADAVAATNIQNSAVTDAKIVSMSGSKVSGGVALATNAFLAGSASELHTYVTTSGGPPATTFWDVYPAIGASPGIIPHDLVFAANGAAQMVIRPNGLGTLLNTTVIGPWTITTGTVSPPGAGTVNNALIFSSSGVTRMALDVSGNGLWINSSGNGGLLCPTIRTTGDAYVEGNLDASGGITLNNIYAKGANGSITVNASDFVVNGFVTANGFNGLSDRNLKENFVPIDARAVLERVARLPISNWNFKTDPATHHIGPMAQDFHAAFSVGRDDKHIATVDEGGVALAAIQGLNETLKEKDAKIEAMEKRLADLEELIKSSKRR